MKTQSLIIISIALVLYLFGHLWVNVHQVTQSPSTKMRVPPNRVLGSSLVWQGQEWPLAFEDHITLLDTVNQSQGIVDGVENLEALPYHFLLHRQDQTPIKVELFAKLQTPLVFRLTDWYEGVLVEEEEGSLRELVEKSHD